MRVAVLFPGQGSQYPGMADPWLEHPEGKRVLDEASAVLGLDVVEVGRDPRALESTRNVQLAMAACELAAFEVLRAEEVPCHVAAGHSLGEYAALVAAGALDFAAGLSVLSVRAEAMDRASADRPGGMTALIGVPPEEAREICEVAGRGDVLAVANYNSPKQVVLSGSIPAIERAEVLARGRGAKAVRLQVAGAFHSPLMEPALRPVREALSRVELHAPRFPVVPNASGKPTTQPIVLRDLLARHVVSPVLWVQSVQAMAGMGVDWFLEVGPGDVLGKLARRIVPGSEVRFVGSPADALSVGKELRELTGRRSGDG